MILMNYHEGWLMISAEGRKQMTFVYVLGSRVQRQIDD